MIDFFNELGTDPSSLLDWNGVLEFLKQHGPEKHYVYALWRSDKIYPEPFYVGKGKYRRIFCHFYESDKHNLIKQSIIAKLQKQRCNPLFSIIGSNLSDEDAFLIEKSIISSLGRISEGRGPLANLTEGGEGVAIGKAKGKLHGRARSVFANGVRYETLTEASIATGIYPSGICKKITSGITGFYYEDEGQRPETGIRQFSAEHVKRLMAGSKYPVIRPVIDGVEYPSMAAASASLGIPYHQVRNRCRSRRFENYKIPITNPEN